MAPICSICLSPIEKIDFARGRCGHSVHLSCIMKNAYLMSSPNGDLCPECRNPYYEKLTLRELYDIIERTHPGYGSFETFCYLLQRIALPSGFSRKVANIEVLEDFDECEFDDEEDADDSDVDDTFVLYERKLRKNITEIISHYYNK